MSCEYEAELTAYVDEELEPQRRRQLLSHLPGCGACARTLDQLERSVSLVRTLESPSPSGSLRRAVLSQLEKPAAPSWFQALFRPSVWAPALAMAAAVLFVVTRPGQKQPSPDQLALAVDMEVLADLELLGLESAEDLEAVQQLDQLEARP